VYLTALPCGNWAIDKITIPDENTISNHYRSIKLFYQRSEQADDFSLKICPDGQG
jgi:hypothetical protein